MDALVTWCSCLSQFVVVIVVDKMMSMELWMKKRQERVVEVLALARLPLGKTLDVNDVQRQTTTLYMNNVTTFTARLQHGYRRRSVERSFHLSQAVSHRQHETQPTARSNSVYRTSLTKRVKPLTESPTTSFRNSCSETRPHLSPQIRSVPLSKCDRQCTHLRG